MDVMECQLGEKCAICRLYTFSALSLTPILKSPHVHFKLALLVWIIQTCTEDRDYRGDQCRAFNGVRYRGEKRTWEAIEDPENPCSLTCRAEGTDLLAKLSPKVRDGTRCRSGSLHVCVEGRCEVSSHLLTTVKMYISTS